jgi:hypothetical protein
MLLCSFVRSSVPLHPVNETPLRSLVRLLSCLRTKYVPSLVKIHWGMLILDYTPWSIIVPNMRAIGPMTSEEFHLQGEVGRTNERMNTITYIGLYINQTNSDSNVIPLFLFVPPGGWQWLQINRIVILFFISLSDIWVKRGCR